MIAWLTAHWDTVVMIGSLVLNALGVSGVVPPARAPKGYVKPIERRDFGDRS